MVDWMSPEVMMANGEVLTKILIAVLGWFTWEVIVTLWFDIEVLIGRRPFKWPMFIYWLTKYSMFWANIGLAISQNVTGPVNCQSLYVFNQLMGNTAVGAASTLLMLRVIAIWGANPLIVYPLVTLSAGQWAILLHGVSTVKANYVASAGSCVITAAPQVFLQLIYIYTMIFDFIVLVLSTIGLLRLPGRSGFGLWNLLLKDGVFFFLAAFTANLVDVIVILLNLNPVMNVIVSVPAAAVAATMACRSFVRLNTYNESSTTQQGSNHRARTGTKGGTTNLIKTIGGGGRDRDAVPSGVHVQLDTFVSQHPATVTFRDGLGDAESQTHGKTMGYNDSDKYSDDEKSFMPK